MTLLRDLIEIPERVHPDDFVLRLAEGLPRAIAVRTLRARSADGAAARTCAAEPMRGVTLA